MDHPSEIDDLVAEIGSRLVEVSDVRIPDLKQKLDEAYKFLLRLEELVKTAKK